MRYALSICIGILLLIAAGLRGDSTASSETAGADRPIPWSFHPVADARPPTANDARWAGNPIDAFIFDRLNRAHLSPVGLAEKETLLRRAYFDLLGLPPPPDQSDAFARDNRPGSYERLIDRLLASPQYGERWARHWLDVVRYADTGGFENDHLYPSAWRYRDYVIRSLNANKPLDRFIEEQVAGDELWPDDQDAVIATDLYCVGPALPESAMTSTQLEYEWMTDCADTTGAAFLGLTAGCARCHDHKYDPITQKDYFALHAIFADSDRPYPEKIRLLRIKGLNGLLSDAPVPAEYLNDPRCTLQTEDKTGFHLFHRDKPMEIRLLHRGQLSTPRQVVRPAVPSALACGNCATDFSDVPPDRRRAALARWITAPDNPLTARVLVNRVWAWHFGNGLVRTTNDFGNQGEPPTHPELLDWLARDFVTHGWDLKRLHRQIMRSRTYQMRSIASGPGVQVDPEDRLLWHFPRNRLEGEQIRDAMLACAGTLNLRQFGPPVVPPLGSEELAGLFDAKDKWSVSKRAAEYSRRSIYILVRRTFIYPTFAAFDAPELMASCPRRFQTTVPTQALTLMNSPLAHEQAQAFAQRLMRECGAADDAGLVARAFELAYGRAVSRQEQSRALALLKDLAEALAAREPLPDVPPAERGALPPHDAALADLCLALFNTNEFVYVD